MSEEMKIYNICNIDNFAKIAIYIILFSSIVLILGPVIWIFISTEPLTNFGQFTGGIITSLVGISNALLLYVTFQSGKQNNEYNHYKSLFLQQIDNYRFSVDTINVMTNYLTNDFIEEKFNVIGRNFFGFALRDITYIRKSLSDKYYKGYFNEENASITKEKELEKLEYLPCWDYETSQSIIANLYEDEMVRFVNKEYHINQKIHQKGQTLMKDGGISEKDLSYKVFYQKWQTTIDNYVRLLSKLLDFIQMHEQYKHESVQLLKQYMSSEELAFLTYHSSKDKSLKTMISNIGII